MDLRMLEYFVAVVEEGSISAGARRAMVAQPSVTVAVQRLERELGGPLLERSAAGVVPTEAGRTVLARARRVLRTVEQLRADAAHARTGRSTFTIGLVCGRASAGELTGPILDAFRMAYPDLSLRVRELDFAEQFEDVLDGTVDVALVRSPYEHDELSMDPLFTEPSVLIAGPDHPLAGAKEICVEAVANERFLEVTHAPREWREWWSLAEMRDDPAGIPTEAVGLIDYSLDVLRNGAISPMAASGWRFGGLGEPTLSAVTLTDSPRSVIGVGYRAGAVDPQVLAFTEIARTITDEMLDLVPDALPVERP
jgi:DNA-binding transcriptional LysR family regulator